MSFLVVDPSGQFETGDPVVWSNALTVRNELFEEGATRKVRLLVTPRGSLRYTLDGSEPRNGEPYTAPVAIPDEATRMWVYAEEDGLEAKIDFSFPPRGKKGVQIDETSPARLAGPKQKKLDSRQKTFSGLQAAKEKTIQFEGVTLTIGEGARSVTITVGELAVDGGYVENLLNAALAKFPSDAVVTMTFKKAQFASGHDLQQFAESLGIELGFGDVHQ